MTMTSDPAPPPSDVEWLRNNAASFGLLVGPYTQLRILAIADSIERSRAEIAEKEKEVERLRNLTAGMFWNTNIADDSTPAEIIALGLDVRTQLTAARAERDAAVALVDEAIACFQWNVGDSMRALNKWVLSAREWRAIKKQGSGA